MAITRSAAAEREDRWPDIDLAFGFASGGELRQVLADWTSHGHDQHHAAHHLGPWIYRVFLLPNTLQVDLAFVPAPEFQALAPTFRLMSGEANEPRHTAPPVPAGIIGFSWLYALHARTSLALESPREFVDVQLADESAFEGRGHFARK